MGITARTDPERCERLTFSLQTRRGTPCAALGRSEEVSLMDRRLAVGTSLPGMFVVACWWFTVTNPWVMDRLELAPLALVVTFVLGPLAAVGAVLCALLLYQQGWPSAWYLAPCLLVGAAAFVVNGLCFVFLIAPGC